VSHNYGRKALRIEVMVDLTRKVIGMKSRTMEGVGLATGMLLLLSLVTPIRAQQESWFSGMEDASSLYDSRGFQRDKSRSVDGHLSVSAMNGNVQYRYPISTTKPLAKPIVVSMSYNQNCSYTTFQSYDFDNDVWHRLTRNRPAWILGVNGFAVQALHHVERNVIAPKYRNGDIPNGYDPVQLENSVTWLLDGYDFCNSMNKGRRTSDVAQQDNIRLLREDGSVLVLTRIDKNSNQTDVNGVNLTSYSSVYVTLDANSQGYAYVEHTSAWTDRERVSLNKIYPDGEPLRAQPRVVRYYPGDGYEYVFREEVVPYGVEQQNYNGLANQSVTSTPCGWEEVSPSIFYLTHINFRRSPVVSFSYFSHGDDGRGRRRLQAFDLHSIEYGVDAVTVRANGLPFSFRMEDAITSGRADNTQWYVPTPSKDWDDPWAYGSKTSLITSIIDPELRITSLRYDPSSTVIFNTPIPRKIPANAIENNPIENTEGLSVDQSRSALVVEGRVLRTVVDNSAAFLLEYRTKNSPQENGAIPLTNVFQNRLGDAFAYVKAFDNLGVEADKSQHYKRGAQCAVLKKCEKSNDDRISDCQLPEVVVSDDTYRVLWEERFSSSTERVPGHATDKIVTTVVRDVNTCDGLNQLIERHATESEYRTLKRDLYSLTSPQIFGSHWRTGIIYHTAPVRVERSLSREHTSGTFTFYDYSESVISYFTDPDLTSNSYDTESHLNWHGNRIDETQRIEHKGIGLPSTSFSYKIPVEKLRLEYEYALSTGPQSYVFHYRSSQAGVAAIMEDVFVNPIKKRTSKSFRAIPTSDLQSTTWEPTTELIEEYLSQSRAEDLCEVVLPTGKWQYINRYLCWRMYCDASVAPSEAELYSYHNMGNVNLAPWMASPICSECNSIEVPTQIAATVAMKPELVMLPVSKTLRNHSSPVGEYEQRLEWDYLTTTTNCDLPGHFGYLTSERVLSRNGLRQRQTDYTYENVAGAFGNFARLKSTTGPSGATTTLFYDDESDPNDGGWGINGTAQATATYNGHSTIRTEFLNHQLASVGSRTHGLPSHTKVITKKIDQAGSLVVLPLRTTTSYNSLGEPTQVVDNNGHVSRFEYDLLGRISKVWLPFDLVHLDDAFIPMPNYDQVTRGQSVRGVLVTKGDLEWTDYKCCPNETVPGEVVVSTEGLSMFDPKYHAWITPHLGNYTFTEAVTCATLHLYPPCPEEPNVAALPVGPYPCVPSCARILTKRTDNRVVAMFTVDNFKRGVPESITEILLNIRFGLGTNVQSCFPVRFALYSVSGSTRTLVGSNPAVSTIVNCAQPTIHDFGPPNIASVGASPGSVVNYAFDYAVDATPLRDHIMNSVSVGCVNAQFELEIYTDTDAEGILEVVSVDCTINGNYGTCGNAKDEDFTLAYHYKDHGARQIAIYSKIDDRSQVTDISDYPTIPEAVYSRHTRRRLHLGTDDLVVADHRNFGKDFGPMLGTTNAAPTFVESTYDGAGRSIGYRSPRSHYTDNTFDPAGRMLKSLSEATDYDGLTNLYSIAEMEHSYTTASSLQLESGAWPLGESTLAHTVISRTGLNLSPSLTNGPLVVVTCQLLDYKGRLTYSIENYLGIAELNKALDSDPQTGSNCLPTKYMYDVFDRVIEIVNPNGQTISYTYDDFGNVSSTEQPDHGLVIYGYDYLGNLRYSQNAEQRHNRRVTFRQYDDLGRPTIVGEARVSYPVNTAPYDVLAILNPDAISAVGVSGLTLNPTVVYTPVRPVPDLYSGNLNVAGAYGVGENLVVNQQPMCPELGALAASDRFNPIEALLPPVLQHAATIHARPNLIAPPNNFENVSAFPEFVLQAIWYDELPPMSGAVWGTMPPHSVWDALAPTGSLRNLKGRPSVVAYRTHGGQPFHFIARSYDERGRVEAMLRFTENLGFDAVYYLYNSANKVTSMHVVDPVRQFATFYAYDNSGRIAKVWTKTSQGFGALGMTLTPSKPTFLLGNSIPAPPPDVEYSYDVDDAIADVSYPNVNLLGYSNGLHHTYDYNSAGVLRTSTLGGLGAPTIFQQTLSYRTASQIKRSEILANGVEEQWEYQYDGASRLFQANGLVSSLPQQSFSYAYDPAGNRTSMFATTANVQTDYTYLAGTNHLMNVTTNPLDPTAVDDLLYNLNGAVKDRTKYRNAGTSRSETIEEFSYDAFNLIEIYRSRRDVVAAGPETECEPDASTAPVNEWRYRFNPLQEREQKRQYLNANGPADGLAWTYTLLGADARQLATYNGIQGPFCNEPAGTVWMWPVEYNAYGPANTRVILRPNGAKDYAIADHLGSVRLLLGDNGMIKEQRSYGPFGEDLISDGNGARTSYIGRETDTESNLGFFGVRLYDPTYGRFMSVDPLWGKYGNVSPFHYGFNNPINLVDASGLDSAGWATVGKIIDIGIGLTTAAQGVGSMLAGGALLFVPSPGVTQIVGGLVMIPVGAGQFSFGTAKAIDAWAALVNDVPSHEIPSSYGDAIGTGIAKSVGINEDIGGAAGSFAEGGLVSGLMRVGAKGAAKAAYSLAPYIEDGVARAGVAIPLTDASATILQAVSEPADKKPATTTVPTQRGGPLAGASGGLPAAVNREVD